MYAFLRTAYSLWWLACKALAIVWSFYYDDYVSLSVDQMASNTDHAIKAFLFILGWSFATDGEKFMHFSEVFTALGVTICLSESLDGRLTISNTAKRVSELAHIIQGILDDGFLPCGLALKLRGRMQFCWTFHPNSLYHSIMLLYTQEEHVPCQCTFGSRLHEEREK